MFLKDLDALIKNHALNKGTVTTSWTFCKRGENYGLCLVKALK
jgi:hypothetical protein